ncbi:MAG TPA: sugar kinase [Sphingomicrobium sp.]|nr:sugar kinase [Sphingomicrobium sp.]
MAKIACFGEILLRLVAPGRELLLQRPHLDVHVGGAEKNVAVALACLGHDSRMISLLPDNPLGQAALGEIRRHGVDVSGVGFSAGRMGLYFMAAGAGLRASQILYDREASSFALAGPEDFDWDRLLDGVDQLHLSGITPALGDRSAAAAIAAAQAARAEGLQVSFDVNYRGQLWRDRGGEAPAILRELAGLATILFANHRDLSLLLDRQFGGTGPDRRRAAAEAAFEAFPGLGLIGSTARRIEDSDRHSLAARVDRRDDWAQTEEIAIAGIVDRIGGGDAFAAGVLHGIRQDRELDWTARAGLALACLKHGLPGDHSLFGAKDVEDFLAGASDVRR